MSLRNTKQRDLILSIVNNSYSHPGALDIYNEAVKLIVKARFNKILSRIEDEDLRNEIIEKIEEQL